jgi:Golgi phosphoprotein 3 (GPP34)
MLIAEDLLLLLTDDRTGKPAVGSSQADIALGGAMLIELRLAHRVDLTGESEARHEGRLVVRNGARPLTLSWTKPLTLSSTNALVKLGERQGKKPKDVVRALGKGLRERLHVRLAERGVLRETGGKILGVFPPTGGRQATQRTRTRYGPSWWRPWAWATTAASTATFGRTRAISERSAQPTR